MKKTVFLSCTTLLVTLAAFYCQAAAQALHESQEAVPGYEPLTLQSAVEIALKESPFIASKKSLVSAFGQRTKAAKGAMLPRLDAYTYYKRLSDPQLVIPMKALGSTDATFSRDHYGLGLTLKIPLYEGGRLRKGITIAELSKAVSEQDLNMTRQELIYNVTNLFNQILFLRDLKRAQDETLKALKKVRKDAQTRLDVGRLAPVDLLRIDTQIAEQESSLVATREEMTRAMATLAQLMGREPGTIKDVSGRLVERDPGHLDYKQERLEKLIDERPDIQKAKREMELAAQGISFEKGLHLPRVELVGDYGRKAGSGLEGDEEIWSAGIVLSLNIFSGGVISAKVREAEARYLAARNGYEHLRLKALKDVEHAVSEILEAKRRLHAARTAVKSAEESFRIEEIKYQKGAGTVTDSLLAQAAWLQARANLCRALFDSELAFMDYKLAIGRVEE